jgi:dipeptidyl aminopeptidase/acylaminoacyl peptidase
MPTPIWTPEALLHYPLIEHVHMDTGGTQILYTVRRPHRDEAGSEFRQTTYLVRRDTDAAPRPLTGDATAAQPRFSPDGRWIAFLRPTPDTGKLGLWVMPSDGGEPWPLTGQANGIRHDITLWRWSPDGQSIAFCVVPWDEAHEDRIRRKDDMRRHHIDYRFAHLYVVPFAPQPATQLNPLPPVQQLTEGRMHVSAFAWRPDSTEIALIHQPTPYLETWSAARLATVAVDPAAQAKILALVDRGVVAAWAAEPHYSPDGRWIACECSHADRTWPYAAHICLFAADPAEADPTAAPRPLADVPDDAPTLLGWSPDSGALWVKGQQGFATAFYRLPIDGGAAQPMFTPTGLITATHLNPTGQVAFVCEDFTTPQAVYALDLATADPATQPQLVAQPQTLAYPAGPLPRVQMLSWQSSDGMTVEGALYLPAGYDAARDGRLPLLLHIHGGPASVFQRQFAATPYYYTPAALVERGIALLRINPRGSGGYGKAFRQANVQDWGGGDFRDLMQGVDEVIDQGIADPDRLGICGWSYGGYMTSWSITQTDRFVAASIGAPVTNLVSFVGTADIPSFIPGYFSGEFWEQTELYLARSPLMQAHQAKTPAIIQHGDADERVPLEQGLQYYMALARNGVPVEMFIYPRQGHAITEPNLLADAILRNLEWFTAKLGTPNTP